MLRRYVRADFLYGFVSSEGSMESTLQFGQCSSLKKSTCRRSLVGFRVPIMDI